MFIVIVVAQNKPAGKKNNKHHQYVPGLVNLRLGERSTRRAVLMRSLMVKLRDF